MEFTELDLHPTLSRTIAEMGWSHCTPVQEVVIPKVLDGADVAGLAQTGTGKTGAFLIPLIERILRARDRSENESEAEPDSSEAGPQRARAFPNWKRGHYILILVPTRELAQQVFEEAVKLGEGAGLRSVAIYGGAAYEGQRDGLRAGAEFVIGTPGRLIDLYKGRSLDLRNVRAVVFDEADRMFDMGFKADMVFMLKAIDRRRQFLVFSATLNFDVLRTAYRFGSDPVEFNLSQDEAKAEGVADQVFHCSGDEKPAFLLSLLARLQPRQAIIFSNFKSNVERIAEFLKSNGYHADGISSQLSQAQRLKVLERFKSEDHPHNILVATDVAARGLDIQGVDLVVNYELPDDQENYVHRIGRTGRAGASGTAYSLVSDADVDALMRIEKFLQHKVEVGWLDDADLLTDFAPMPRGPRHHRVRRDIGPPRGGGGRRGGGGPPRGERGGDASRGPRGRRDRDSGGGDRRPRRDGDSSSGERGPRRDGAPTGERPRRDTAPAGERPRRDDAPTGERPRRDAAPSPEGGSRGADDGRPRRSRRRRSRRGPSSDTPKNE